MGKSSLKQKQSLTMSGIFDATELTIEGEEIGVRSIMELLKQFDGKDVSISIGMTEEI